MPLSEEKTYEMYRDVGTILISVEDIQRGVRELRDSTSQVLKEHDQRLDALERSAEQKSAVWRAAVAAGGVLGGVVAWVAGKFWG
jgi:hypothetical protein